MIRMKKLAAFAVGAALVVSACGGDDDDSNAEPAAAEPGDEPAADSSQEPTADPAEEPPAEDVERGGTLVTTVATTPQSMEASHGMSANWVLYYQTVYDPLIKVSADGTEFYPHLATDWSYNDDLTVLTMNLRDDVTFSDGEPFNAEAAAANLLRFRDGDAPDKTYLADVVDVVATDDYTIDIELSAPNPALLWYLSRNAGFMQSPATFGAADAATNPIGTGPYVLDTDRTVPDDTYYYTAREGYWRPDHQLWDEVVLRVIQDGTALVNAIRAEEIMGGNLINRDAAAELEASGFETHVQTLNWVGLSLIDREGELGSPLDNLLVRQAISHAIDREAILDGFGTGAGEVTQQAFHPANKMYDPAFEGRYDYDVELAKQLMDESGVGPFTVQTGAAISFMGESIYAILQDSLAEIGITLDVVDDSGPDFIPKLLAPTYPMYFMFLAQNPTDWVMVGQLVASNAVWNPAGVTDATVDELLPQMQSTPPGPEYDELAHQLGDHISEQAWTVPFYRQDNIFVSGDELDVTMQAGNAVPYLWNFVPEGAAD